MLQTWWAVAEEKPPIPPLLPTVRRCVANENFVVRFVCLGCVGRFRQQLCLGLLPAKRGDLQERGLRPLLFIHFEPLRSARVRRGEANRNQGFFWLRSWTGSTCSKGTFLWV